MGIVSSPGWLFPPFYSYAVDCLVGYYAVLNTFLLLSILFYYFYHDLYDLSCRAAQAEVKASTRPFEKPPTKYVYPLLSCS
jgi:hypothetical protein